MDSLSPARKAAFQILLTVERSRAHADNLLLGKQVSVLSAADRNLATALVLGVLRWQIPLDEKVRSLLNRPKAKLDAEVQIALRMGAFQLIHLDRIPARAAIDESVELAKQAGHRFASGMVNAVLRKLAGTQTADQDTSFAAEQAYPRWLVDRWLQFYGTEATHAICEHGQRQPALAIRVMGKDSEAELRHDGIEAAPGQLLKFARIVTHGEIAASAVLREGQARVQDEGSQLVAEIAASCGSDTSPVTRILDACAAPGGKTLILAEGLRQARIVACEASEQRLAQMRKRLASYTRIECRLADASTLNEEATFDLALVDAPCSGTGTLGRNPEIRYRLRPEDLAHQAERQRAILAAAVRAVRPGGWIVYSTCSLEPEENDQVVASVLADGAKVRQVSLESCIAKLAQLDLLLPSAINDVRACLTPEGALRLLPDRFNTDGFFIALLERTA
jgi:16S rRNA (cytosine967-C5)-methyltransferase